MSSPLEAHLAEDVVKSFQTIVDTCLASSTKRKGKSFRRASTDSCFMLSRGRGAMLRWVVLALFISLCAFAEAQNKKAKTATPPPSRGWGKIIKWVKSYEEGLAESAKSQKPLMVIHHLDNCPHSKALKGAFVAHKSIQKMAKDDFIMLNLVEETGDKHLAPDGYYVPRILFVDPSHTVRADIVGKFGDRLYTYGPDDMELLAANMKKVKLLLHNEL